MNPLTHATIKCSVLIAAFCTPAISLFSQEDTTRTFNSAHADSLFTLLEEHDKFYGAVHLQHQGKTIYENGSGFADISAKTPNTAKTEFRIGSISKTFTAVMILQAVSEGKLKLTDSLAAFFPEVKNARDINIDMLLMHRSGIYNITDSNYLSFRTDSIPQEQMMRKIARTESDFTPGTKFGYSNTNYILLTYILEAVTEKSFAQNIKERISDPLKLENTYFNESPKPELRAKSYRFSKDEYQQVEGDHPSVPLGAGGIVSTPRETAKFFRSLFIEDELLDSNLRKKLLNIKDGYGRGIAQFPYKGKELYGHTGAIDAFNTIAVYFPKEDVAVAVFSNHTAYPLNDILIDLVDNFFDTPGDLPDLTEVEVPEKTLLSYTGVYSKEDFPLKITIALEDGRLTAQGTGQPSFELTPKNEKEFVFLPAGVRIVFRADSLTLHQGSMKVPMTKESKQPEKE